MTEPRFLDDPEDWAALAAVIRADGVCGWDTETYGHNVKKSTPAYRAKIDEWSMAVRTDSPHPRGYRRAAGFALPLSALLAGPLRAVLEDPGVVKVAHNARHDMHAAANYGVAVASVRDTLETARLVWAHLREFNLKALRVAVLGKDGRDTFKDLTAPLAVEGSKRKVPCPIESIIPGHPRRVAKVAYMVDDAVDALELAELEDARLAELAGRLPELPW